MAEITLRSELTRPLTNVEMDANFATLNSAKLEGVNNLADLVDAAEARANLELGSAALRDALEIEDAEILALVGI